MGKDGHRHLPTIPDNGRSAFIMVSDIPMAAEYLSPFFDYHREGARNSARVIVPLVLEQYAPESLVDVGCGTGTWLSVFKDYGITDVLGIDGNYVDRATLDVPAAEFQAHDLTEPLQIGRQFDLVVSLEVGEHLPAASVETFVESLTQLGPVILFSAGIPFQGGTNHVNEQWPDYWANLFGTRGFVAIDSIRKHIWQNDKVEFWYAQNIMFFVRQDHLDFVGYLRLEREKTNLGQLSIVHPKPYLTVSEKHAEAVLACERYVSEAEDSKARTDLYIAEVKELKTSTKNHKAKAEQYIKEAEECKEDAQSYRARAELYIAEVKQLKDKVKDHKTRAEYYMREAEKYRAAAAPGNMSLPRYLKALPTVLLGALKRKLKKKAQ